MGREAIQVLASQLRLRSLGVMTSVVRFLWQFDVLYESRDLVERLL